jgi:hypothetical protein
MSRATEAEVIEIMDTALTEEQVAPFLTAANLSVTNILSDEGYDDATLKEIERWLAAHLVAIRDRQISDEKIGDATVKYGGKVDLGLNFTPYGQQVMILDHHGKMAQVADAKRSAELKTMP